MTDKTSPPKDPEKTVDLPPHGSRNADPITDTPGSHPIETGVGAALAGAASGMAVGLVAGPLGAAIGAAAGAIAGGYAGKGVGELIDPTTKDNWIRDYYAKHHADAKSATVTADAYRPAYDYGVQAVTKHHDRRFDDAEPDLRSEWETTHAKTSGMAWDHARGAVRDAFDRTLKLREEKLNVNKTAERTGDVGIRKEVITEHKTVTVPVEREEVVIERRAVTGHAAGGTIKAEEIRIPVMEEKVHVTKEAVVKEEVTVGKRKVHDTETVGADVRREELKVEETGDVRVKGDVKPKTAGH